MIYEKHGRVVKGLGGLYEVLADDGEKLACRATGNLKRDEEKVLIGDTVTITIDDATPDGIIISKIDERKNSLIRPPLANLDYLFIVFAAKKPSPVIETVDKLTAIAEHNSIIPVIVITKTDLDRAAADEYAAIYRSVGYPTFVTSSETGEGTCDIKNYISEKLVDGATAAFAGASGVGKSTLLNFLFPDLSLATSEISRKIERGRHTTRHVELFSLAGGGFLADTPGFSLIDFERFDFFSLDDISNAFPEIRARVGKCRYVDCAHVGERADECAIARAVLDGEIPESRVESYRSVWRTLKAKKGYN